LVSDAEETFVSETQETTAKWITGTAVFLYAWGLLVTNYYLASIGVSDFSSLKPKFILTGGWAFAILFFVISPGIPLAFLVYNHEVDDKKEWFRWKQGLVWSGGYLLASLLARDASLFWLWPDISLGERLVRLSWWLVLLVGTWPCTMLIAFVIAKSEWFETKNRRGSAWLARFSFGILVLGVLCIATYFMATRFYAYVPDGLGGGKPVNARLILNERGASFWKQAGVDVPAEKDSSASVPIRILYQSESELVIKAPY
jgi:hypothetical protein